MRERRRIPQFILDEVERIARIVAHLPKAKELAARGNCHERVVQYHLHKAILREKRLSQLVLRQSDGIAEK